jgi:hypothetical protein
MTSSDETEEHLRDSQHEIDPVADDVNHPQPVASNEESEIPPDQTGQPMVGEGNIQSTDNTEAVNGKTPLPKMWPVTPTTLRKRSWWKSLFDVALTLGAVFFLVIGFVIKGLDGKLVVESPFGRNMLTATGYVSYSTIC